jgi:hypothetical protein
MLLGGILMHADNKDKFLNKHLNKYLNTFIAGILLLMLMSMLMFKSPVEDPEINVSFHVTDLSEEEYDSVGTTGLNNPQIQDFKKVNFSFEFKQSDNIVSRNLSIPDIPAILRSKDETRYWYGSNTKQDNKNIVLYQYDFVMYTKGLDKNGIIEYFKTAKIQTSWVTKKEEHIEKEIALKDIIQYN